MGANYDDLSSWEKIDTNLKDAVIMQMISNLECVICLEVMHVPFLCSCGHSFCYGCLESWFKNKLNCPTCRKELNEPPVINIQLRDMSKVITDLFLDSIPNLEEGTSLKNVRTEQVAEFEKATQRRKNLFGSSFLLFATVVDTSDGVARCGNCHWEAHGSRCLNCGERIRNPQEDDYFDLDDGDAYNEDQEEVEIYGVARDSYDSDDSFIDSRDINEIGRDANSPESLPDSEDDISVSAGSWHGFNIDSERLNTILLVDSEELSGGEPLDSRNLESRLESRSWQRNEDQRSMISVSSGTASSYTDSEMNRNELENTVNRLHLSHILELSDDEGSSEDISNFSRRPRSQTRGRWAHVSSDEDLEF